MIALTEATYSSIEEFSGIGNGWNWYRLSTVPVKLMEGGCLNDSGSAAGGKEQRQLGVRRLRKMGNPSDRRLQRHLLETDAFNWCTIKFGPATVELKKMFPFLSFCGSYTIIPRFRTFIDRPPPFQKREHWLPFLKSINNKTVFLQTTDYH